MRRVSLQSELDPMSFGSDGELVSGKFCAYCGNRNSDSDHYCRYCAEYIADQGPDLRSRLARISRRASAAKVDNISVVDRVIVIQFNRCDRFLTTVGAFLHRSFASIRGILTAVASQLRVFRLQFPRIALLFLGQTSSDTDKWDAARLYAAVAANTPSSDFVDQHLPLTTRLAMVRRHNFWNSATVQTEAEDLLATLPADEQQRSYWTVFILLFAGWFIGLAIGLGVIVILSRGVSL